MLEALIAKNYDFVSPKLTLIDSHFGTEIFRLESGAGKYIVKTMRLNYSPNRLAL